MLGFGALGLRVLISKGFRVMLFTCRLGIVLRVRHLLFSFETIVMVIES